MSEPYMFADAYDLETEIGRLRMVEALNDPFSIRNLEGTGVAPGWRCLEVGAGAGSLTRWLAEKVAPTGSVTAVDVRTTFLEDLIGLPGVDVVEANVVTDPLPEGGFDLIHARWTLIWIPERAQVLERLVQALRPGGWIVLEESFAEQERVPCDADYPGAVAFERLFDWILHVGMPSTGIGEVSAWTRSLPTTLRRTGLTDVNAETDMVFFAGATPRAKFMKLTIGAGLPRFVAEGHVQQHDADNLLALLDDPEFFTTSIPSIGIRGRRSA